MEENKEEKINLYKQKHASRIGVFKQAWLAYLGVPQAEIDGIPNPEKEGKTKPITLKLARMKDETGKPYIKLSV